MQDIHGIRPPVQVGLDPMLLKIMLMVLVGILVLGLLFFLIRKWLKKRRTPKELKLLPEPMAPYDASLKELELLFQRPMIDPRLFYFDLTYILRKYIGRSFNIRATEMTSQEFIRNINQLNFSQDVKKDISKFQNLSDPFKYAGMAAQKEQVKQDLAFIKQIICRIEKDITKQSLSAEET